MKYSVNILNLIDLSKDLLATANLQPFTERTGFSTNIKTLPNP